MRVPRTWFGVSKTPDGVFIQLSGDSARSTAGGELRRDMAIRLARTILDVAGDATEAELRERLLLLERERTGRGARWWRRS